ncbi:XF1762 family protein [Nocardia farcinica]|uniref:XF1762 family protein n=1 Tax=Nocardia farcinica TaxID=37329 RepID=UPI002453EFDF|nr:XF1762 family protein [Nocardia farcinica]
MPDRLALCPVSFEDACAFVTLHHRHHLPPQGHKYSIGAALDGSLVGVAIVGRPVARHLDDGRTLEVTRVATDGTRNACSLLYAAAWRAARNLGYTRLITYTQATEGGASLRASGWRVVAERRARRGWDCPSRPRIERGTGHVQRTLWEAS